jgi:hypothetical protein
MIRQCTDSDVEWMFETGNKKFSGHDKITSIMMFHTLVNMPEDRVIAIRGEDSFGIAHCFEWMYNPTIKIAEELVLASTKSGWEIYNILKQMTAWARKQGATDFRFSLGDASRTGKSLEPFAKRLGAVEHYPTYRVNFETRH